MQSVPRLAVSLGRPLYALVLAAVGVLLIGYAGRLQPGQRRGHPALAGQAGHRLLGRERRHRRRGRGRRQHRHPLVQRRSADPQWLQVDLGATAAISQVVLNWEAAYAAAYQIQVSAERRPTWTNVYSTTTGDGGVQTPRRHRHRPLRPDERHRRAPPATATRCGSSRSSASTGDRPARRLRRPPNVGAGQARHRVLDGERRHPRRRAPSTATPAPAGPAPSATRSGSRSTSARRRPSARSS